MINSTKIDSEIVALSEKGVLKPMAGESPTDKASASAGLNSIEEDSAIENESAYTLLIV